MTIPLIAREQLLDRLAVEQGELWDLLRGWRGLLPWRLWKVWRMYNRHDALMRDFTERGL